MERRRHRHPGTGAGRDGGGLLVIAQFIKYDHIGGQATHRTVDALRLGIPQQDVAPRQSAWAADFPTLIHHRDAVPF